MTTNPFTNTFIEFHILQSFPVSCLNRDDVGAPKSAIVGGVSRVSSQSWKRPVRLALQDFGIKLGVRTKNIAKFIANECEAIGATPEQAATCSEIITSYLSKDTLLFFTQNEAKAFAKYAQNLQFEDSKLKDKDIYKVSKKSLDFTSEGIDIALFGRMVAQSAELNVKAACSFAHAISTHKVANEVEFFTAVDDLQDEDNSGSAHMGSLEYNSATYYRYISLDLGQLYSSLVSSNDDLLGGGFDSQDLDKLLFAIEAFIKALYMAVPTARQTTMSGASMWDYAKVLLRKGQRLQLSFDKPVKAKEGYLQPSIESLNQELALKEKMSGSLFGKIAEITLPDSSIDDLIDQLRSAITQEG
jgi:CRISPR system Cascade subunit CasC